MRFNGVTTLVVGVMLILVGFARFSGEPFNPFTALLLSFSSISFAIADTLNLFDLTRKLAYIVYSMAITLGVGSLVAPLLGYPPSKLDMSFVTDCFTLIALSMPFLVNGLRELFGSTTPISHSTRN